MNWFYKFLLKVVEFENKILLYLVDKNKDGKISNEEWEEAAKTILSGLNIIFSKLRTSIKKK